VAEENGKGLNLNLKQEKFVYEFTVGEDAGNVTRSYMRAYDTENEHSAAVCGCELLKNPKVATRIEEHRKQVREENRSWVELAVEAKSRLVELSKGARSENVRLQALLEILNRGFGRPEIKINIEEKREQTSRAARKFAGRLATEEVPEGKESEGVVH
jgi:phage terminase small subunit